MVPVSRYGPGRDAVWRAGDSRCVRMHQRFAKLRPWGIILSDFLKRDTYQWHGTIGQSRKGSVMPQGFGAVYSCGDGDRNDLRIYDGVIAVIIGFVWDVLQEEWARTAVCRNCYSAGKAGVSVRTCAQTAAAVRCGTGPPCFLWVTGKGRGPLPWAAGGLFSGSDGPAGAMSAGDFRLGLY
jgi:hypothetical protein